MIQLNEFEAIGFKITWKLIDIGFKGSKQFANQLSVVEILNYAIGKMEECDQDSDLINLSCEYETNIEEINKYLKKLSLKENTEFETEFRKWRVIYVLKNLPNNQREFIQGLVDLGDIWAYLEFPDDSPHVFQSKGNSITPDQYYTLENYRYLLKKHEDWIKKEIEQIFKLQTH